MKEEAQRLAKRTIFEQWLQDFASVSLIINPQHASGLPTHLKTEPQISLEYGLHLAIPINDLLISDVGVDATLSFGRTPHTVFVPWDAVGAIHTSGGDIVIWPSDASEDFVVPVPEFEPTGTDPEPAPRKKFPVLRLVTEENKDTFEPNKDVIAYTGSPKLRLVN